MRIHEIINESDDLDEVDAARRGFLGTIGKAAAAGAAASMLPKTASANTEKAQTVEKLAVENGQLCYIHPNGKFPIVAYDSSSGTKPRLPAPMWNSEKTKIISGPIPLELEDKTPAQFFSGKIYIDLNKQN